MQINCLGWCGVIESQSVSDIKLYPNPTTNIIRVKSDYPIDNIKVFDIQGKIVNVPVISKEILEQRLDLSKFQPALYIIEVSCKKQIHREIISRID